MPSTTFRQARIAGVVAAVPRLERSLADDAALYGGNAAQLERIRRTIGLDKRRVAPEGVTAADLCEAAARHLLAAGAFDPAGIDAVVCVTQTPDFSQPCNACVLHGRLGLGTSVAAFDINLGCSGYVYGLHMASMLVEAGGCRNVLLLAGDTVSRLCHPRDRAAAPLFGDAGSATWVTGGGGPSWYMLHTDGAGAGALCVPAGGSRRPADAAAQVEETDADGNTRTPLHLKLDGPEIFNFSLRVEPESLRAIAAQAGRPLESVDHVFFHQANRYIIGNIVRRLKLPAEKAPSSIVERYGNQSSASIPVVMADTLAAADHGVARACILSGFGVGLSWATAWIDLAGWSAMEIVEV